jgi:hypothetical protein
MKQQSIDNHYVSQMYLKNWSTDGNTIWMYRRLVSHKNVEWWKKQSINGTAYLPNLYSYVQDNEITDEFENWLNCEIETPAKISIEKAVTGAPLSTDEWLALLRFTAAQIVRTPAYYIKHHVNWIRDLPEVLSQAMEQAISRLTTAVEHGRPLSAPQKLIDDELMPLKLSRVPIDGNDREIYLKAETIVGRTMWLSHIRRMVNNSVSILRKYRWHIIKAAHGIEWPTSDDPVICLAYRNEHDYSFEGGIAQKNAEILFPLSPKHLLYTSVGNKASIDKFQDNEWFSRLAWRLILEHSFLHVYSKDRQKGMFQNCPRTVNAREYKRIHDMLLAWYSDSAEAEIDF